MKSRNYDAFVTTRFDSACRRKRIRRGHTFSLGDPAELRRCDTHEPRTGAQIQDFSTDREIFALPDATSNATDRSSREQNSSLTDKMRTPATRTTIVENVNLMTEDDPVETPINNATE